MSVAAPLVSVCQIETYREQRYEKGWRNHQPIGLAFKYGLEFPVPVLRLLRLQLYLPLRSLEFRFQINQFLEVFFPVGQKVRQVFEFTL